MEVRQPPWAMTSNRTAVGAAAAGTLASTTSGDGRSSKGRGWRSTMGSYLPRGKAANSPGAALAAPVCRGGHGYGTIDFLAGDFLAGDFLAGNLLAGAGRHPLWR